jgi:hypothetical protein
MLAEWRLLQRPVNTQLSNLPTAHLLLAAPVLAAPVLAASGF